MHRDRSSSRACIWPETGPRYEKERDGQEQILADTIGGHTGQVPFGHATEGAVHKYPCF